MKTMMRVLLIAVVAAAVRAQMELEGDIVQEGGLESPIDIEQEALPGTAENVTYTAVGQFASALGKTTCTFSNGAFLNEIDNDGIDGNVWFIRSQANPDGEAVEGCQPMSQTGAASRRRPRNSNRIGDAGIGSDRDLDPADRTGEWCFIGEVNSGGNAGDGKANYNMRNGAGTSSFNEWAYCKEERSKTVRYTASKSFSAVPGFDQPGAPCAAQWNFNNNTNGVGGIKVGVLQSCLPFADYKPRLEGLDWESVPEADRKYWCFLNTGAGAEGYNPVKTDGDDLDSKTLDWGFCQDALAVEATAAPSAAPSASPSQPPAAGETGAPTSSASSETTPAPTTESGEQGGGGGEESTDQPSAANALASSIGAALLAVLVSLT